MDAKEHESKSQPQPNKLAGGNLQAGLLKRMKGLLNRLSESNLVEVFLSLKDLRGGQEEQMAHSAMTFLLTKIFSGSSPLQDSYVMIHSAFIAGLYRLWGRHFATQLIRQLLLAMSDVTRPESHLKNNCKSLINVASLLSELCNFEVIGSDLLYQMIKDRINDFSDSNAELLLRILKCAGPLLKKNNPYIFGDIVLSLQQIITKLESETLSFRTKFMLESLNCLDENDSRGWKSITKFNLNQRANLRKVIQDLPSEVFISLGPLEFDISQQWEAKVDLLWEPNLGAQSNKSSSLLPDEIPLISPTSSSLQSAGDSGDFRRLAKSQHMNTDARRSIFVAIISAADYKDAYHNLMKLRLKRSKELEISRVLMHCIGKETSYNPYYTLLAAHMCRDKQFQKAMQTSLWDTLRLICSHGSQTRNSNAVEHRSNAGTIVNLAKAYGSLVSARSLRITVLKMIDFSSLRPKTRAFLEIFFIALFLDAFRQGNTPNISKQTLKHIFHPLRSNPRLRVGLLTFLRSMKNTDFASSKEALKTIVRGCQTAEDILICMKTIETI